MSYVVWITLYSQSNSSILIFISILLNYKAIFSIKFIDINIYKYTLELNKGR